MLRELEREKKVKKFMDLMDQKVSDHPSNTPLETRRLALKLIFEELEELAVALDVRETWKKLCEGNLTSAYNHPDGDNVDEVETLDALADIEYTTLWGVNATGLGSTYNDAFNEVCRSNDSKGCDTFKDAKESSQMFEDKGISTNIIPVGDKFVIKDKNGKVKKPINYSPAQLEKYVPSK
jgi:predicted HAD superfamily Cof-like phosphohydrolase